jgi:hypothetical protein
MRKSSYQHLIDGLAGIAAPEEAKRQFAELIRRSAALDGVAVLERQERAQFARHLLDLREPRAAIRDRLMSRYDIGRTQAYQVIEQALQLSGFPDENRTEAESNEASK